MALGDSLYARYDPLGALDRYSEAERLSEGRLPFALARALARCHYDIGLDALAERGAGSAEDHFKEAVSLSERLVASFPDSAQAHFLLAATLGNLAQFKGGKERIALAREVERQSRTAIELDPDFAYPYVALGILYRELAGLSWVEQTWAHLFYGELPKATIDDALALLCRAAELDPLIPFVQHELATTYLRLGDTERGLLHLRQLLVLKPQTSQDIRNQTNARLLLQHMAASGLNAQD
ncbi:MAG: hypothetical protein R2834_01565 [Rhodothermales bacterium]